MWQFKKKYYHKIVVYDIKGNERVITTSTKRPLTAEEMDDIRTLANIHIGADVTCDGSDVFCAPSSFVGALFNRNEPMQCAQ